MASDEENEELNEDVNDDGGTQEESSSETKQKSNSTKQIRELAKNTTKNSKIKNKKAFEAITKIASKLGPAIPWILLIILIIVVVTGIIGFLMTMPGMMVGKLKDIAQGVADWWQSLYSNAADAYTNEEDIIETANYIKSMGYDLVGNGFVLANVLKASTITGESNVEIRDDGYIYNKSTGERFEKSGSYFDKYGIQYSVGGDETGATGTYEMSGDINGFAGTDTSLLRTYIMSDKRMYMIRNFDDNNEFFKAVKDTYAFQQFNKSQGDWAKGLLSLYKAEDFIANEKYSSWEAGSISVDAASKTMTIKKGWTNNPMKFDMEGWSGRYGLSLEFLLSLHLATLAPDLVSTMARTFDTEVQVYLDSVKHATVEGLFYNEKTDSYIERTEFYDTKSEATEWVEDIVLTKRKAFQIMKNLNLESQKEGPFACQSKVTPTLVYANNYGSDIKDNDYESQTTTRTEDYHENVILAKKDGQYSSISSADTWAEVMASTEKTAGNDVVKKGSMYTVQNDVNWAIWYATKYDGAWENGKALKDIFTVWDDGKKDEEGNTAKTSSYNYTYYWDSKNPTHTSQVTKIYANENVQGIGDVMKVSDFRKVIGSYNGGGADEFEIVTFREPTKEEDPSSDKETIDQCRELTISILVYRTQTDANYDFLVIAYISPSEAEVKAAEQEVCSAKFDNKSYTKCCSNCRKYIRTLRTALREVADGDFNTYIPYIARVIDSWFRDTYFVVPDKKYADGKNPKDEKDDVAIMDAYDNHDEYGIGKKVLAGNSIEFINVDTKYLEKTEEYWTEYKMYDDGTYKLFVLKNDGNYAKSLDELPEGISAEAKSRCQISDDYVLYTGTEDQADIDGIKLSKMAVTSKIDGKSWEAYGSEVKEIDELRLLEVDATTSKNIRKVTNYDNVSGTYNEVIYYRMSSMPVITQTEDGKRGVTNPTVKKMFKIKKYYIYDGTSERAEAINNDWKSLINKYKNSVTVPTKLTYWGTFPIADKETYAELQLEKAIDDLYFGTKTSQITLTEDPRDPALISNISINKDSLAAFSILENTHTLDSDYAYRDFKELIVELNYFDKEDLSEGKEKVFEWILPELGSYQWPHRQFDKSEELYGTMLHSREMYDLLEEKEGVKQAKASEHDGSESTENENDLKVEKSESDGTSEKANIAVSSSYLETLKAKAQEIADYCTSKGYKYNTSYPSTSEPITELRNDPGVSCCAGACWVLAETSPELATLVNEAGGKGYNFRASISMLEYFRNETNFAIDQVTSQSELQPGDLVIWLNKNPNKSNHTQLYLGDGYWFNSGGSYPSVVKVAQWDAVEHFRANYGNPYAIHLSGTVSTEILAEPFEGYELGNAVVAPVTGKIVGIGTSEITNEPINGEEKTYEVDYIKIQALSEKDLELIEADLKDNSHEYEFDESKITKTDYDAYKDFCEEYKDVCQDYVITVKGFKGITLTETELTELDTNIELTKEVTIENAKITKTETVETEEDEKEIEIPETDEAETKEGDKKELKINNYTKKITPNLIDESKENDFEAIENAKFDAKCMITVFDPEAGEDVTYIKAGTLIGHTTDANIKILLRDDKNAIVENVEEYMEINNGETTYGIQAVDQEYVAQSGDLELLANLLHHEGCEAYFARVLKDQEIGQMASRVTGYVLLNRAILNYGSYGTTIREQILAPGQYSTAYDVTTATADYCDKCLANAEYCLKYDCSSIISPQKNTPMPRNVVGQSGWCHCNTGKYTCWWWVDTTQDGNYTEADARGKGPYDTFYCVNNNY